MNELERALGIVAQAERVVVATGAGMSKESGLPTFRDAQEGLWARYRPEELATRQAFRANPSRVWGWYNYRRGLVARHAPHAGHLAVARMERLLPSVAVVTQNVDGMHRRAGSTTVLELHGNINRFKCFDSDHPVVIEIPIAETDGPVEPPSCSLCGSYVRPDVVWYGEMLPAGLFEEAAGLARACDVMLVVGTSGIVYPAAALPGTARSGGASVIEINVQPSELSADVDLLIQGRAGEILPQLVSMIERLRV